MHEIKFSIMKTKHFLITTEDGSVVAVVNCTSDRELVKKIYQCIREQLDDPCIGEHTNAAKTVILANSCCKIRVINSMHNGDIYAQRIEIY